MKLHKRVTKTANTRGNESRIAKQDSKKFPRMANPRLARATCIHIYRKSIVRVYIVYVEIKVKGIINTHKELIPKYRIIGLEGCISIAQI